MAPPLPWGGEKKLKKKAKRKAKRAGGSGGKGKWKPRMGMKKKTPPATDKTTKPPVTHDAKDPPKQQKPEADGEPPTPPAPPPPPAGGSGCGSDGDDGHPAASTDGAAAMVSGRGGGGSKKFKTPEALQGLMPEGYTLSVDEPHQRWKFHRLGEYAGQWSFRCKMSREDALENVLKRAWEMAGLPRPPCTDPSGHRQPEILEALHGISLEPPAKKAKL